MDKRKTIIVFGVGELQCSIIRRARAMGLRVVGIDPDAEAFGRAECDAFEVVGGQDYEGTCAVVDKYGINAIVTAATDKPLVMMARIAEKYHFPFYSVKTAEWSTDKYQMKQRFEMGGVQHAKGKIIHSCAEVVGIQFPLICKPRDNSGSRGVKLCRSIDELQESMDEALANSHLDTVLVEEYIEGQEYSIESLHYGGKTEVIQFTEKKTTTFPYNVELGHKQPANLTEEQREEIRDIVGRIAKCMDFTNCPSHTELKINDKGTFVIETSPRLGGDFITSTLTPLSTGISLEDQLLHIALGEPVDTVTGRVDTASAVCFLSLPVGIVDSIDTAIKDVSSWPNVCEFEFKLKTGDKVNQITSSLNRYGQFIVSGEDRNEVDRLTADYERRIKKMITIVP